MLEITRQMTFKPGSNRKGQVAGANWAFLLPEMALERVVCFGAPSERTLITLTLLGRAVTVVTLAGSPAISARANLTIVHWEAGEALPPALTNQNGQVDLILVTGAMIRRVNADTLRTLLKPQGWLYLELNGPLERRIHGQAAQALAQAVGQPHWYWSTPLNGELHTAIPAEDQATIDYFIRRGLYQPEVKKRVLKKAVRLVSPRLVANPLTRRTSLLVSAATEPQVLETQAPPHYLRAMAEQAGLDIRQHRWGLVAHGQYSTRKILFYLFPRDGQQPETIVKMVRDPAHNLRLENEHRALTILAEKSTAVGWFPRAAFFGKVNGLDVLAEGAVAGVDFRQRTTFRPDDALARQVVQRFTRLAQDTLDLRGAAPDQAADVLTELLNQFADIYQPGPALYTFLEKQIDRIGAQTTRLPLVFQHGDPGIWNMLVTGDNRVVVLDWESAETGGLPLWDLFYFLRSYLVAAARQAGIRDALQGFERYFFDNAAYNLFALESVEQYRKEIALPMALVEPLFYTCWMHRSLKEANRLAPEKLAGGHYYNLLRLAFQRRDTPALNRLFKSAPALEGVI